MNQCKIIYKIYFRKEKISKKEKKILKKLRIILKYKIKLIARIFQGLSQLLKKITL